MTIAVFLLSLLAAMALGMPIAYALIVCGIALMAHLDIFDSQIIAQNIINGADSFPLMAVPFFLLAGEIMNVGGLSKRIVDLCLALVGHIKGGLGYVTIVAGRNPIGALRLCGSRCGSTIRAARSHDGRGGARSEAGCRSRGCDRDHWAGHSAQHRLRDLWRSGKPLDHETIPGGHHAGHLYRGRPLVCVVVGGAKGKHRSSGAEVG